MLPGNTFIGDIARRREAEINSRCRQIVVVREKEARVVEAENRQETDMEVKRIRQVPSAGIERDAAIECAQGDRQAVTLKRDAGAELVDRLLGVTDRLELGKLNRASRLS